MGDRTWKGTDHAASLEPHMLKELIEGLNHTYQALTYKDEDILPIEMVQRKKLKYGQYNADDIKRAALKKGKIYSEDTQKFGKKWSCSPPLALLRANAEFSNAPVHHLPPPPSLICCPSSPFGVCLVLFLFLSCPGLLLFFFLLLVFSRCPHTAFSSSSSSS